MLAEAAGTSCCNTVARPELSMSGMYVVCMYVCTWYVCGMLCVRVVYGCVYMVCTHSMHMQCLHCLRTLLQGQNLSAVLYSWREP